jgi:hypothetical protein
MILRNLISRSFLHPRIILTSIFALAACGEDAPLIIDHDFVKIYGKLPRRCKLGASQIASSPPGQSWRCYEPRELRNPFSRLSRSVEFFKFTRPNPDTDDYVLEFPTAAQHKPGCVVEMERVDVDSRCEGQIAPNDIFYLFPADHPAAQHEYSGIAQSDTGCFLTGHSYCGVRSPNYKSMLVNTWAGIPSALKESPVHLDFRIFEREDD